MKQINNGYIYSPTPRTKSLHLFFIRFIHILAFSTLVYGFFYYIAPFLMSVITNIIFNFSLLATLNNSMIGHGNTKLQSFPQNWFIVFQSAITLLGTYLAWQVGHRLAKIEEEKLKPIVKITSEGEESYEDHFLRLKVKIIIENTTNKPIYIRSINIPEIYQYHSKNGWTHDSYYIKSVNKNIQSGESNTDNPIELHFYTRITKEFWQTLFDFSSFFETRGNYCPTFDYYPTKKIELDIVIDNKKIRYSFYQSMPER